MPPAEEEKLECREMRESDTEVVLEMLRDGWRETENSLLLFSLTRPAALLLMAVVSSALRFVLGSCLAALMVPLLLSASLLKLGLASRRMRGGGGGVVGGAGWSRWDGPGGLLVAHLSSREVCGCVGLSGDPGSPTAEIHRLAVGRWHRRSGVGSFLVDHAEWRAREAGFPRVRASVEVTNKPAIALFQKLGYRPETSRGRLCCRLTLDYVKDL